MGDGEYGQVAEGRGDGFGVFRLFEKLAEQQDGADAAGSRFVAHPFGGGLQSGGIGGKFHRRQPAGAAAVGGGQADGGKHVVEQYAVRTAEQAACGQVGGGGADADGQQAGGVGLRLRDDAVLQGVGKGVCSICGRLCGLRYGRFAALPSGRAADGGQGGGMGVA